MPNAWHTPPNNVHRRQPYGGGGVVDKENKSPALFRRLMIDARRPQIHELAPPIGMRDAEAPPLPADLFVLMDFRIIDVRGHIPASTVSRWPICDNSE